MATALKPVDQLGFDEEVVNDPGLEDALEDRQTKKERAAQARKTLEESTERVLAKLEEHLVNDGDAIRVGRFRIVKRGLPAREVSFEAKASSRITITAVKD